ncbi:MAG TPA: CHY zinc finger protein [Pyrinomonadaceae bacterium]|jgi:uncharacterized CHY-type Zn-finger protein
MYNGKISEKIIHGAIVVGADVDGETRCAHYHSALDIIAIKFKCCEQWFPCYECHAASADHASAVWSKSEFDTNAILCGACGAQLTVNEYLKCESTCPQCSSRFNPGCARHYYLYFE